MPRPYKQNPRLHIAFGQPPAHGRDGVSPVREPIHYPNPPDPREGITLHKQVRGRWYWHRLDEGDQLSQAEAAAFLRVSRMQVNRWVRAGKLREKKILGTSRIAVRELLRFARATGRELGPTGLFIVG
jgi:excisionase family DNA binding protein